MKRIPNLDAFNIIVKRADQSERGNNVLHILLAQEPIDDNKLDLVMYFLEYGFDPTLKNHENKTFVENSNIGSPLAEKIQISSDSWTLGVLKALIANIGGER